MKGWKTFVIVGIGIVFVLLMVVGVNVMYEREYISNETHLQLEAGLIAIVLLAIGALRLALKDIMEGIDTNTGITTDTQQELKELKHLLAEHLGAREEETKVEANEWQTPKG